MLRPLGHLSLGRSLISEEIPGLEMSICKTSKYRQHLKPREWKRQARKSVYSEQSVNTGPRTDHESSESQVENEGPTTGLCAVLLYTCIRQVEIETSGII